LKLGTGHQKLILGAPGCGKTSTLLNILDKEIQDGVAIQNIAFVSFTRKAVQEVVRRTCEKFNFERADLYNFKTIHAMAYREIEIKKNELITSANMEEFSKIMQMPFSSNVDEATGLTAGATVGDEMLFYASLARVKQMPLEEVYQTLINPAFTWHMFLQIATAFDVYRQDAGILDFTDILTRYANTGEPLSCEVAFIDEAQDLSSLQWSVLRVAFARCKRIYIAGDDDQAIYSWSGADIGTFLQLEGEKEILGISHRMPKQIFDLSQKIIQEVGKRYHKDVVPRNEMGSIEYHNSPEAIPINPRHGSWLILARNIYALPGIERNLKLLGIPFIRRHGASSISNNHLIAIKTWEKLRAGHPQPGHLIKKVYEQMKVNEGVKRGYKTLSKMHDEEMFTIEDLTVNFGLQTNAIWHDALKGIPLEDVEYYLTILRTLGSEGLTGRPEVHVNTIHGVKGGEADNVVLHLDMAKKTYEEYLAHPDAERRVMYVGVTRAKRNLHIVQPQSNRFFQLPV
jgi:DNA helicase-2/ATP-dependent DNA helicase PcrA